MSDMIKVYVASQVTHAPHWRRIRDEKLWGPNIHINSRWLDEQDLGNEDKLTPTFLAEVWERNLHDVGSADVLVCYADTGRNDSLRGALVEAGAALSWNIPIIAVGPDTDDAKSPRFGSWQFHPKVTRVKNDLGLWKLIPEVVQRKP